MSHLPAPTVDPKKNPSYPQRVHLSEKPRWLGVLASVESRLDEARQSLKTLGNSPNLALFEKLYAQMLGARDQVQAAVKRLPQETGHLYEEDHHKVDDAVAALDRLFVKWDEASKVG